MRKYFIILIGKLFLLFGMLEIIFFSNNTIPIKFIVTLSLVLLTINVIENIFKR